MSTEKTFKAYGVHHFTAKSLETAGVPPELFLNADDVDGLKAIEPFGIKPKMIIAVARKLGVDEVVVADYETQAGLVRDSASAGNGKHPEAPVATEVPDSGSSDKAGTEEKASALTEESQAVVELPDPAAGKPLPLPTKPSKGKAVKLKTKDDVKAKQELTAAERIKIAMAAVKKTDDSMGGLEVPLVGTAREFIDSGVLHAEKIPTPFPALNAILDGGIPRGRFTVIAGPEQSCKSTLAQCILADDQKQNPNGIWLWLDAENSFDAKYAEQNGIDLDRLLLVQPDIMEQMCQRAIEVVVTGAVRGVVIDSVGGFTPWEEVKLKRDDKEFVTKDMAANTMAALAKRIGQFFRMMNVPAARTKTACVLIGHVYASIGDMYGPEFIVKGGNALKHWSHLRIMSRRKKGDQTEVTEKMMPDGTVKKLFTAYEAMFTVDKTRQGAHYSHEVGIPYVYGTGLSNERSIIDMAFAYQIVTSKGAWYGHKSFPERTAGKGDGWLQGRENTEKYILEHPDVFSAVLADVGAAIAEADAVEAAIPHPELASMEETHVV